MQKFKLVFLGHVGSGKTSVITRFMYDTFESNYQATIGIDFLSKTMYLDDRTLRLQLWDTAGQERFRSLVPSYIRDSSVAVVVYDMTDKHSYAQVDHWVQEIINERGSDVILAIIGNKSDLTSERQISSEMANKKALEHSAIFIECSAKTGSNIKELFYLITERLPSLPDSKKSQVHVEITTTTPSESCNC
eukprot:NODE_145_length_17646_cov_0.204536.p10 type:complete len:191 gc:universal NODE_145_length_17646_cov_0.204536:8276-8848(+)